MASLALAACVGQIGEAPLGHNNPSDNTDKAGLWAPASMRRLTTSQYTNSIQDIFGSHIQVEHPLEADESNELFLSLGAAKVGTSEYGVEQYQAAALEIAGQVLEHADDYAPLSSCQPFVPGDTCIAHAIRHFGTRLWRRPLQDSEVNRLVAVQALAAEGDDTVRKMGMQYALAALIASPHFLYLTEVGEAAPNGGGYRYSSYEMASRLAYVLTDSTPDEELLEAAASGKLITRAGVREQAIRLLATERAKGLATRFFGEAWHVYGLKATDKNTTTYPAWTPELLASQQSEFDLFLRDMLDRDSDIFELFSGKTSFIDNNLASFYALPEPGTNFTPAALPSTRYGLLTSGAVLSAISPSDRTSPTHRGVFVLERILCTDIPPPPDDVDDTLNPPSPDDSLTLKQKLEQHRTDPACSGCHSLMDPLGFTFEHFDAIGRYREHDGAFPVDASGELDGKTLNGIGDLVNYIQTDPRTLACLAERFFTYAAAHAPATSSEANLVQEFSTDLNDHHSFRSLVLDVVTSDGFRHLQPTSAGQP